MSHIESEVRMVPGPTFAPAGYLSSPGKLEAPLWLGFDALHL
jgi:hypothetical protein